MYTVSFFKTAVKAICVLVGTSAFSVISFAANNDTTPVAMHPVYPPKNSNIEVLKQSVAPLMKMSVKEVIVQVPAESGIFFVGCPNCHGGVQEMDVLQWKPGMGSMVRCKYCQMEFPNKKFPNNREKVIIAPSGVQQVYRYYEDSSGHQYYFEPHAWYERWSWIRPLAEKLAILWYATRDNAYGDRAAAIAGRFAQVFPDYAIRYDYPDAPKQFFPANQKWPYKGLTPYRGAKWRWWGYDDIPFDLANVYDILMDGYDWKRMNTLIGLKTDQRIARDLLRLGYEFTTANPEVYSNKSPGMYSEMIRVGRILGDPSMVHEAVKRFREFFPKGFFADGWWKEGTGSYHHMTITSLKKVADVLAGYKDPVDWQGERFDNIDLARQTPLFAKAIHVNQEATLPNGRKTPINDTWGYGWEFGYKRNDKTDSAVSRLWPSLGNATLGTGRGGNQVLLNVNWSGNYGHSHDDNGSIILYAEEQELLSDVGYTHSKYRGWTIHTASHNTVVIDQVGQDAGSYEKPVTGKLIFYDDKDPHVKVVDVDASPSYSMAEVYRRRLVLVHAGEGRDYVVDRFDVKGGQVHDWFLHGMCEQEGSLETSIELDHPLKTLVPDWGGNNIPKTQQDADRVGKRFHAYSYLHDIKTGAGTESWAATWRYDSSGLRSHLLSQPGTNVFRFRSPSVRLAKEDDNKLDDFMHNGIMQRHPGGASSFIAVHEPFRKDPWMESVQMEGEKIIVRYRLNEKLVEDRITLNDWEVKATSSAGWEYQSGKALSGQVKVLENINGKVNVLLDREVPKTNYIRFDFRDGGTYYWPVASITGNRLELEGDPGFSLDENGKVQFHTFPLDEHQEPLRYTLFVQKLGNP
ncbi:MAG: heparinase II/III family protein [Chitinophagaceae bacterium]